MIKMTIYQYWDQSKASNSGNKCIIKTTCGIVIAMATNILTFDKTPYIIKKRGIPCNMILYNYVSTTLL